MDRQAAWVRAKPWLAPVGVLVAGWLALMVYAYPGFMSFDSVLQLQEARSGVFSDWHPAVMAELWRWCDRIVDGPLLMLLIQTICFLAGLFMVLRRFLPNLAASIVTVAILLFPPVSTTMAVIWKDSQMIAMLVLGTALLLSRRRGARIAALVLFVIASALRHNAPTITFFLVVLLFQWSPEHTRLRRYALAVGVWVLVTITAQGINQGLTDRKTYPWHNSVALFDIVGTIRFAPYLEDSEIKDILAGVPLYATENLQAKAKDAYSPFDGHFQVDRAGYIGPPATAEQRAAVGRAWRTLVWRYPTAYLRHRYHAFRELLQLKHRNHQWVWAGFDDNSGEDFSSDTQIKLREWALWFGKSWLMHPYFYFILLLCLLPFCLNRGSLVPRALALSGLTSELALFFLSPTPDFRYSIWLVCCALIVPAMLIALRLAARRERASHGGP